MKAFSAAMSVKDPEKKLAAWTKFLKEYPESALQPSPARELVNAAFKAWPKDEAKILAAVLPAVKTLKSSSKATALGTLSSQLNQAGLDAVGAEKYGKQAVSAWKWKEFAAEEPARAAKAKRELPSGEALRARFAGRRATARAALGQLYAKNGKNSQAEKNLKAALKLDATQTGAALKLGDLAENAGRLSAALEYLAQARLAKPDRDSRKRFDDFYAKTHDGSQAGIEEFLDARYARLFPNPAHAAPYSRTAARADRVVLAEVYTGSGCGPCAAADLAFDTMLERYARQDLAVLMYHQHIPRPDPMTNDDTQARWKFVAGRGVPTYIIDGRKDSGGGLRREAVSMEKTLRAAIDKRLEAPAEARLSLQASRDGQIVRVRANASEINNESPDVKLRIVLVEKLIRYAGENGIRFHPMVVRAASGFALDGAKSTEASETFDLDQVSAKLKAHIDRFETKDERHNPDGKFRFSETKYDIDAGRLAVVAFLEDQKTKAILQAAYVEAQ